MPPGTVHFVVTLEDSFFVGGHHYSVLRMSDTLYSLVWEHHHGNVITNTVHSELLIIVFKFTQFTYACLIGETSGAEQEDLDDEVGVDLQDLHDYGELHVLSMFAQMLNDNSGH